MNGNFVLLRNKKSLLAFQWKIFFHLKFPFNDPSPNQVSSNHGSFPLVRRLIKLSKVVLINHITLATSIIEEDGMVLEVK